MPLSVVYEYEFHARACVLVCHLGRGARRGRRGSRAAPTRRGASPALPGRAGPARSPQRAVCPSRPSWPARHCRGPRGLPSASQGPLRHPRRSGGSGAARRATRRRSAGASGLHGRSAGASGLHGRAWRGGTQGAAEGSHAPSAPPGAAQGVRGRVVAAVSPCRVCRVCADSEGPRLQGLPPEIFFPFHVSDEKKKFCEASGTFHL